jgi:hypothetical protein
LLKTILTSNQIRKSILKLAAKITEELSQLNGKNDANQNEMQHTKERLVDVIKKKWKNKIMHGQYIRNMDRQLINEEGTSLWLSKGDLKAETESEIVAAQDQTLNTKYYTQRRIVNADFSNNMMRQ